MAREKQNDSFVAWAQSLAGRKIIVLVIGLSFAIFLIGLLFKLLHWPGGSSVLMMGAVTLAFIFMVAILNVSTFTKRFNASAASISALNMSIIIGLFSLSCVVIGAMFKILHWPGASHVLIFGCVVGIISSIAVSFTLNKVLGEEDEKKEN